MAQTFGNASPQMQEAIRRRATELFQRGGAAEGHDAENWYQAEAEILRESAGNPPRRAVVVNVRGVVYTGNTNPARRWLHSRRMKPGDPVPVRLAATNSTSAAPTAANCKPPW